MKQMADVLKIRRLRCKAARVCSHLLEPPIDASIGLNAVEQRFCLLGAFLGGKQFQDRGDDPPIPGGFERRRVRKTTPARPVPPELVGTARIEAGRVENLAELVAKAANVSLGRVANRRFDSTDRHGQRWATAAPGNGAEMLLSSLWCDDRDDSERNSICEDRAPADRADISWSAVQAFFFLA